MRKKYLLVIVCLSVFACKDPSKLSVENRVSGIVMKNVEWGKAPIAAEILPGQTSAEITIDAENSYYDIDLPESNPVKFVMQLDGDIIYLVTDSLYKLEEESDLLISINDSTRVYNPLAEESLYRQQQFLYEFIPKSMQ